MIKSILNIVLISIFFLGGCKALCKENKKVQEKDDLLIGEDKRIVIPNLLSIKPLNTGLVMPSLYRANSNKGKALVKKNYGIHIDQKNILNRLKAEQHCNGSWGSSSSQQLSTAFALIALLRVGESKNSYFFGKTVQTAHDWLLNSNPQNDFQRIATAVALSDYYTTHYENRNQAKLSAKGIHKIIECLDSITPQCNELWNDFLILSRTPIKRNDKVIKNTYTKYFNHKLPNSLSTINDYMLFYLCFIARYQNGSGKKNPKWRDANKQIKIFMTQLQDKKGLFTCNPKADKIAVTGLFLMNLAVNYIFSHDYSPYLNPMKIYSQNKITPLNQNSAPASATKAPADITADRPQKSGK